MMTASGDEGRESSYSLDDLSQETDTEPLVNRVGFVVFGFVNCLLYSVTLSAAQDVLAETLIPTAVVFAIIFFFFVLVAFILPHFIERIPHTVLLGLITMTMIGGGILYAVAEDVLVRLAGVMIEAAGLSLAEVTYVSMTALYRDNTMAWYSLGTGIGFVSGPVYFAGMTTLLCVSPKTAVLIVSGLPVAFVLFHIIMDKRNYQQEPMTRSQKDSSLNQSDMSKQNQLTSNEKLTLMLQSLRGVLALMVGGFGGYITISSVVTTMAFRNSPFDPRNHYLYYVVTYAIGEFVGRSQKRIFSLCNPEFTIVVRKTWILAGILAFTATFLAFASWYRFLPNVWVVLLLVFVVGFLLGEIYLNTLLAAAEDEDFHSKVFSRGFSLVGLAIGILLACLTGSLIETVLREHCLQTASFDEFCFTRSMTGWNSSSSCLTY